MFEIYDEKSVGQKVALVRFNNDICLAIVDATGRPFSGSFLVGLTPEGTLRHYAGVSGEIGIQLDGEDRIEIEKC